MISAGTVDIVSRLPLLELEARAGLVKAGLFDFDGTLHAGNTWASVCSRLPDPQRNQEAEIRKWYWSQVHNGRPQTSLEDPDWFHSHMPFENQAVVDGAWVASDVHAFVQAGFMREDFTRVALELGEREGAVPLLRLMGERAIITFGLEPVALDWLKAHKVRAAVAGTRLLFDERGRLTGHHPNVVASSTKASAAKRFRELTGFEERELLVLGDAVTDVHMMTEGTFNVLLVPRRELDRKLQDYRENNLESMWDRLSAIVVSDSLVPLERFLFLARA
ncbi:haloacid dehalogenase-like hydrolase [Candidatus Uhrbacteria bacterium]|nr:haloacid dehalogenase-like hydrolase [Candidatus Uhrbacteria bacterium]